MLGKIEELCTYPVKGLSAQPLKHVTLSAGQGFPFDRVFGFARPGSGFDPSAPKPMPKSRFYMLARDGALATLRTRYDADRDCLTIRRAGADQVFDLTTAEGRQAAASEIAAHLGLAKDDAPTLYRADPHRFTDVSVVSEAMMNAVSLINLDTVSAFGAQVGKDVSAARFRGNIMFSGVAPGSELQWVGRTLAIGDARLEVVKRTQRCPATEVDPLTGQRDMDTTQLLQRCYGHKDMGVYAQVRQKGRIAVGDTLNVM